MNLFIHFIFQYGLIIFFLTIIISEYTCISYCAVLPFSSLIASLLETPYTITVAVTVVASLIGTSICYLIGYLGGFHLLNFIKKHFPKSTQKIDATFEIFKRKGAFTVFIARFIPICRTYIGFIAGAAKLDYVTYITSSCIGISLWNSILIGIAYLSHNLWKDYHKYFDHYKDIIVFSIVLVILILILLFSLTSSRKTSEHTD